MWMEAPVIGHRTSVGLDVHARSVVGCALDGDTGEVFERRCRRRCCRYRCCRALLSSLI